MAKIEIPHIGDETTNRTVRLIVASLNNLLDNRLLNGQIITHKFTGTSEESVPHKLGRKPLGVIPVGLSAAATMHGRDHDSRFLKLTVSAACTADLWVF